MRRTIVLGLAAATFVTVTSWANMSKRAAATQSMGIDIGAIHRSVNVASLPVAPVESYEAY
jgi:hypothetical protein